MVWKQKKWKVQVWEQKRESYIMDMQTDQCRKREDYVMEVEVITRDPYIQLQGQLSLYTLRKSRGVPSACLTCLMCSFRVHNWCRRRNISRNMEATHSFCHDPRERGCWLELSDRWRGGECPDRFWMQK